MKSLDDLLQSRRSVRAFLPDPVARGDIEKMCRAARRAPSGANLQPGAFHVLTGSALVHLRQSLAQALNDKTPVTSEYSYFPQPMPDVLKQRQREAGRALYQACGIGHRDVNARRMQFAQNYAFFGAPVGVVVTIHRDMGKGCFMDMGMSLMAFLLKAEDLGYGATGIGALANYGPVVHKALALDDDEMVVCGLAIGRPDMNAPVNTCTTTRERLDVFTSFAGFDDQAT